MSEILIQAKVVVIGGIGVGKSSLTIRYVQNQFNDYLQSTLGAVYFEKIHKHNNKNIKYQFWDTAGQQKYKAIAKIYYKDCRIAVVVYDVTSRQSFEQLKGWIEQLKNNGPKNIIMAIVGNKTDLVGQAQAIPYQQALQYANSLGALLKYTSAKQGKGIEELFDSIADQLQKQNDSNGQSPKKQTAAQLKKSRKQKKSTCC